jgi:hypothetical protein
MFSNGTTSRLACLRRAASSPRGELPGRSFGVHRGNHGDPAAADSGFPEHGKILPGLVKIDILGLN